MKNFTIHFTVKGKKEINSLIFFFWYMRKLTNRDSGSELLLHFLAFVGLLQNRTAYILNSTILFPQNPPRSNNKGIEFSNLRNWKQVFTKAAEPEILTMDFGPDSFWQIWTGPLRDQSPLKTHLKRRFYNKAWFYISFMFNNLFIFHSNRSLNIKT